MGKLYEHTQTRTHPSLLTSKAATECPKYAAIYKMRAKESRGDGIMSLHKKARSHKHFGQIGNLEMAASLIQARMMFLLVKKHSPSAASE